MPKKQPQITQTHEYGCALQNLFLHSVIQIAHSSKCHEIFSQFSSVQSLSRVRLFATPWITARQASLWNLTYLQIFFNHWKCKNCSCIIVLLFSHSVISDSLGTPWTEPTRPLCPWDFPGKNTVVGCHYLLQGIFLTQGLNPHLLHWQVGYLLLRHVESPKTVFS